MSVILNDTYVTYPSYECLNACLVNYLRFLNYNICGSDVFFIGDGSGFVFKRNEKEGRQIVATRQYEANYEFCRKVGLEYSIDSVESEDQVALLGRLLKQNGCVILQTSTLYLSYNPLFRKREAFHYLNILGLDSKNGQVYISDGYIPMVKSGIYEGWIPLEDILTGWKRTGNKIFSVKCLPREELYKNELENVYGKVIESLENYICGSEGALSDNKKICLYIDNVLNKYTDEKTYQHEMSILLFNLKGNGFFAYKHFVLEQLQRNRAGLWENYAEIVKKWEAWYMNVNKLRITYKTERNKKVYERFLMLTELEEACFEKIVSER